MVPAEAVIVGNKYKAALAIYGMGMAIRGHPGPFGIRVFDNSNNETFY